ncbi:MAG: hypothetical protein LBD20_03205 [Spirochaetaceae bacterium]|jgi:DNA polymerase-3 subunit gamma/tau|nr:hypothetical protein [Spirochaetaceae bacterium]
MFENTIEQSAVADIIADLHGGVFPPAVLFRGPEASGKGTAALETARVLSCRKDAAWTCDCPSCTAYRDLTTKDLLIVGPRPLGAEILACSQAFLRDFEAPSAEMLFLRSIRKLLLRFSPVLREGDSDVSKLNTLLESINDTVDRFIALCRSIGKPANEAADDETAREPPVKLVKIVDALVKDALKLEDAGIASLIPVSQIRHAAFWLHKAPDGFRKTLIIENADRMKDEARNSLLKTIEEPAPSAQIILCSSRPRALMQTILSRLRPYIFVTRSARAEADIIRRVFRDPESAAAITRTLPADGGSPVGAGGSSADAGSSSVDAGGESRISAYLDSFMPVPKTALIPLAARFAAAVAGHELERLEKTAGAQTAAGQAAGSLCATSSLCAIEPLRAIERCCAAKAEAADMDFRRIGAGKLCADIAEKAGAFQTRRLFADFIAALLTLLGGALAGQNGGFSAMLRDRFRVEGAKAVTAVTIYNQNAALALEKLFYSLQERIGAL